jgi:hypothetical protein
MPEVSKKLSIFDILSMSGAIFFTYFSKADSGVVDYFKKYFSGMRSIISSYYIFLLVLTVLSKSPTKYIESGYFEN